MREITSVIDYSLAATAGYTFQVPDQLLQQNSTVG